MQGWSPRGNADAPVHMLISFISVKTITMGTASCYTNYSALRASLVSSRCSITSILLCSHSLHRCFTSTWICLPMGQSYLVSASQKSLSSTPKGTGGEKHDFWSQRNKVLIIIIRLPHYTARGMGELSSVFFLSVILTELTSVELSVTYKLSMTCLGDNYICLEYFMLQWLIDISALTYS